MSNILVVDDDVMSLEFLKIFLEGEGHVVVTAEDMKAVSESIDSFQPKILICDLNLGDESGEDIITFVRAAKPDVTVILITGYDRQNISKEIKYDFLMTKPVDLSALQNYLSKLP